MTLQVLAVACPRIMGQMFMPSCRIQRHNKTQGGPMAALTPFSLAKMYFTSKRILRKEGLKNVYNLLGSVLLTSRCEKYYIN